MKRFIIIVLIGTFLSSCVTMNKVSLEVLRPAQDSLSYIQKEVSLVNEYLYHNKKKKNEFKNLVAYDKYRLDSLVSVEALKAVNAEIEAAGLVNVRRLDTVGVLGQVDEVALKLKKINIRSIVETDPVYVNSRGAYYAAIMVPYYLQWEISSPEKVFFVTTYNDTVWAEGYNRNFETLGDLVQIDDIIRYIIDKTAVDFAKRLFPTWHTVNRYYIASGNNDFGRADYLMNKGKYDEAAEIWEKYVNASDNSLAAKALVNMAVYYELKGNVDEALVYARRSAELKNELAQKYVELLEYRKKEINSLLKTFR
ncbi:MAG: DUF6340 family protein [Salinivirgaceae bacterium]